MSAVGIARIAATVNFFFGVGGYLMGASDAFLIANYGAAAFLASATNWFDK